MSWPLFPNPLGPPRAHMPVSFGPCWRPQGAGALGRPPPAREGPTLSGDAAGPGPFPRLAGGSAILPSPLPRPAEIESASFLGPRAASHSRFIALLAPSGSLCNPLKEPEPGAGPAAPALEIRGPRGAGAGFPGGSGKRRCQVPLALMSAEAAVSVCDPEFGSGKVKEPSMGGRSRGSWYERFLQPCLVELLGSALFIFIGCLSVIENGTDTGRLQPALAHGLALGLIIATLGNISGGHFNPAVSLAATLIGGLNLVMLLPYWIAQLCGGLIGAALAKAVSPEERFWNASGAAFVTVQEPGQVVGPWWRAHPDDTAGTGRVHGRHQREDAGPSGSILHWLCRHRGHPGGGCCVWSLHESCPCLWTCRGGQSLGLPLDLLAGPAPGQLLVGLLIRLFIGDGKTRLILRGGDTEVVVFLRPRPDCRRAASCSCGWGGGPGEPATRFPHVGLAFPMTDCCQGLRMLWALRIPLCSPAPSAWGARCQPCPAQAFFPDGEAPMSRRAVGRGCCVCMSSFLPPPFFLLLLAPDSSVTEGPSVLGFLASCTASLALQ
uniref:Aquaporin 8 n=1 Tax=Canis lupus familiaris TaxID=9615 RepID=A0A8C0Q9D9_CANLF